MSCLKTSMSSRCALNTSFRGTNFSPESVLKVLVSLKLFHFHLLFLYFYVVNSLMGALEFKSWTDLTRNEMFAWRLKISWRWNTYVVNSQNKLRCSWTELISALFILLDQPPYTIYVCIFTTSQERVPLPLYIFIPLMLMKLTCLPFGDWTPWYSNFMS